MVMLVAEAGKGFLTLNDLRRVATEHDFTWTDKELTDMIYFFDSDKDRKVSCSKIFSPFFNILYCRGSFCNYVVDEYAE